MGVRAARSRCAQVFIALREGFSSRSGTRRRTVERMRIALLPLLARPRREVSVLTSNYPSMPVLIGDGEVDFTCWRCGCAICEGMGTLVEVSGRIFCCPDCTAFNRSRV